MGVRNFLVSASIVVGGGAGGYAAYIHSLTKYLEPIPQDQAQGYVKALEQNVGGDASVDRFTFAYRAPTVVPTHRDMVAVFGEKTVAKQSSYIASNGAKKVGNIYTTTSGNAALGSLFALQSLEGATPLLPLRAAALFLHTFQISGQWHLLLHNRKATMAKAREAVVNAASAAEAAKLVQAYCANLEELTLEKSIKAIPDLRMAAMRTSCGTAVAAALQNSDKEHPWPREAELLVFCTFPIPPGVEEGSFSYKARRVCGDWYTRWLAVNTTSALAKM